MYSNVCRDIELKRLVDNIIIILCEMYIMLLQSYNIINAVTHTFIPGVLQPA